MAAAPVRSGRSSYAEKQKTFPTKTELTPLIVQETTKENLMPPRRLAVSGWQCDSHTFPTDGCVWCDGGFDLRRGAYARLKGEWCSALNNSTLCCLTTTGRHCLEICNYSNCDFDKWASNTLLNSENTGCVTHEECTKSIRWQKFNLPAFGWAAFKKHNLDESLSEA